MICLDASVAAKLILIEERSDLARALYQEALLTRRPIIAPLLLRLEVTNFLRQRLRAQVGLSLADAYGLLATYDAHYLALSEHFGCDFWTDDQRLLRQVGGQLPFVRPLSEYSG